MSSNYPTSVFQVGARADEPILSANLAAVRGKVRRMSAEYRWAIAGLLLAQAMVVLLYLILVDNIAQVETKRLAAQQQAHERHRCAMLQDRLEREQCLVAMAPARTSDEEGTVLAAR